MQYNNTVMHIITDIELIRISKNQNKIIMLAD